MKTGMTTFLDKSGERIISNATIFKNSALPKQYARNDLSNNLKIVIFIKQLFQYLKYYFDALKSLLPAMCLVVFYTDCHCVQKVCPGHFSHIIGRSVASSLRMFVHPVLENLINMLYIKGVIILSILLCYTKRSQSSFYPFRKTQFFLWETYKI